MLDDREGAREISYAHSAQTRGGRAMIRFLENASGRISLIKRAQGYEEEIAQGRDFWEVMAERYGLDLQIIGGSMASVPKTGPLILIANHPYGILDGLMMGYMLSQARGDFRILAHKIFRKADDLNRIILPVNFDETREGMKANLATRKQALSYLSGGGAIGIFPGGTVSTALTPFDTPMDPGWRSFTARMVAKSNATVVPVYFEGANSRLFQLASHLHATLRMGLLIKEFKRRVNTPCRVVIGEPIEQSEIDARAKDARELMDYLREATYALSPKPLKNLNYGFEFEQHHRKRG
ncbi:MAG: lysophospholipid acyltransferase family protein [Pseudoprimorskyibacter sp.]|nr:lysophospholipid acyltransferase family protein [Pseudoprimorskyibacter sp.]